MDSSRNVISTVTLNSNAVQEFRFAPYVGTFRVYMQDGSRNNQLYLVSESRQANVPCGNAIFDNSFVGRSNWGHDALFSGQIGYFSYTSGVLSYGALANLAAAIHENPQNAPGNWLKSNPVLVPGFTAFDDVFTNPANTRPAIAAPAAMYLRPVIFDRSRQK
jgi:hypothetical protein